MRHCDRPYPGTPFLSLSLLTLVLAWPLVPLASGETDGPKRAFNLPAQPAESALKLFADQSGQAVIMNANTVQGIKTNTVKGEYTTADALYHLLDGTGLVAVEDPKTGAI